MGGSVSGRVRVYCAMSVDGFLAGADDDLDWLDTSAPRGPHHPDVLEFDAFLGEVGAMVMGRRTLRAWICVSSLVLAAASAAAETRSPFDDSPMRGNDYVGPYAQFGVAVGKIE